MKKNGLTLVELLMAMSVATILTLGLNQVFQQSYRLWSATESRRPVYMQSNLFLEHMRTECSGLYLSAPVSEDINQPTGSTSLGQAESTTEEPEDVNTPGFRLVHQPGATRTTLLEYNTLTPAWGRHLSLSRPSRVRYEVMREDHTGLLTVRRYEQLCAGDKLIGNESQASVLQGLSDVKIWVANPGLSAPPSGAGLGTSLSWKRLYESKEFLPGAIKVLLTWPLEKEADVVSFEMVFDVVGLHATENFETQEDE